MKTSAIVCAVLAGSLGFGTLASAQDRDGRRDGPRAEQRDERREDRREQRAERREQRAERRDDRRDDRQERWQDRRHDQAQRAQRDLYEHRHLTPDAGQHRGYVSTQPGYAYNQPRHYANGHRFQRGGYLPHEYRQNRGYYVNDWRAHRGLYAPPHGHQWMQVGTDFVLVALATGLIANLLIQ